MSDEQTDRWDLVNGPTGCVFMMTTEGEYVLYDDHKAAMEKKDTRIRELEEACRVLAEECRSHRDCPSDDEMNTGDPENEAVNLIRMARCGTAMDAVDAHPVAKKYVEGKE